MPALTSTMQDQLLRAMFDAAIAAAQPALCVPAASAGAAQGPH